MYNCGKTLMLIWAEKNVKTSLLLNHEQLNLDQVTSRNYL